MRSGFTNGAGSTTVSLYTVPADSVLVLTDFSWNAGRPSLFAMASPPNIRENQGRWEAGVELLTDGGPARWIGRAFHAIFTYVEQDTFVSCPCEQVYGAGAGGLGTGAMATEDHSGPIEVHWTTGLVFGPSSMVDLAVGIATSPVPVEVSWSASWSGYLVPSEFASGLQIPRDPESPMRLGSAPNPLRNDTSLSFRLAEPGDVVVAVFDVTGRRVRVLHEGEMEAGPHSLSWDGRDQKGNQVADGIYFARLLTREGEEVEKLIRIR
jgi:hypothetical protein